MCAWNTPDDAAAAAARSYRNTSTFQKVAVAALLIHSIFSPHIQRYCARCNLPVSTLSRPFDPDSHLNGDTNNYQTATPHAAVDVYPRLDPIIVSRPSATAEFNYFNTRRHRQLTKQAQPEANMTSAEKPASGVDTSVDAAVPPSLPPPSNQKAPISAVLAMTPSRVDAFLAHLFRCMQARSGAETVLLFACYASRMTGSILEGLGGAAIRQSARRLVALAYKLPPATTVVLSSTAPQPTLAALALQLGGRFKALSAMISETRTMGRLWGLLGLYFAAKRLVLKSRAAAAKNNNEKAIESAEDSSEALFDTLVSYAQIASLIVYQASENVAFLSSKKVLPLEPAAQGRIGLLSVRAWGLYVAMEGARLLVERSRKQSSGVAAKDTEWAAKWNKSFYRNLAWAPLTVHWSSTTGGFLPDIVISSLALYPSVGAMVDLWRDTA